MQPLKLVLEKGPDAPAAGRGNPWTETLLDAGAPVGHVVVGEGRHVAAAGRAARHVRPAGTAGDGIKTMIMMTRRRIRRMISVSSLG